MDRTGSMLARLRGSDDRERQYRTEIGQIVKKSMLRRGQNQYQLSLAFHCSETLISRIITGSPDASLNALQTTLEKLSTGGFLEPAEEERLGELVDLLTEIHTAPQPQTSFPVRFVVTGLLALAAGAVAFALWLNAPRSQTIWEDDFRSVGDGRWTEVSAVWEGTRDRGAVLREASSADYFGKVESEIISATPHAALCLEVQTDYLDIDSSYTVQVLDKTTSTAKDVLTGVSGEGPANANISTVMGWQAGAAQSFTLNIWISGEGKSATFRKVRVYEC